MTLVKGMAPLNEELLKCSYLVPPSLDDKCKGELQINLPKKISPE